MSIQTANPPETDLNGLEIQTPLRFSNWRIRVGLGSTLLGFLIFMIGARPGLFALLEGRKPSPSLLAHAVNLQRVDRIGMIRLADPP